MTTFEISIIVALYLVGGQLFSLCYLINYKPDQRTAWLGLMGLFWPVALVLDIVLQIAGGFGLTSKIILKKIDKATK